jgi:glyoxylase-like metal-dependent hydrolase (beta-lactamase superfamily II)
MIEVPMTVVIERSDLTIHRIVEQPAALFDPFTFLAGLTPELLEDNRSWLEPAALDPRTGKLVMCIQSYVVRTPHHTMLIDSCVGNDKERPSIPMWSRLKSDAYMNALAAAGLSVGDIDLVMCTHLHVDHVGWNTRLENGRWVPTFPNARYLFSRKELAYWSEQNSRAPVPWIVDSVLPIVAANRADLVTSDHVLDDHVRLEPTPGHTIDHFAVALGRGRIDALMTGDLIHSPLQARCTDISLQVDYDGKQAASTRRRIFEQCCDTDTLICTAHFPSPSTGHVTRWDDGFRIGPGGR